MSVSAEESGLAISRDGSSRSDWQPWGKPSPGQRQIPVYRRSGSVCSGKSHVRWKAKRIVADGKRIKTRNGQPFVRAIGDRDVSETASLPKRSKQIRGVGDHGGNAYSSIAASIRLAEHFSGSSGGILWRNLVASKTVYMIVNLFWRYSVQT